MAYSGLVSGHGFSRAESRLTLTGALAPEGKLPGHDPLSLALHGGDEYELLFTAKPTRAIPQEIAGVRITRIGEILRGREMRLAMRDGRTQVLTARGWEHFG